MYLFTWPRHYNEQQLNHSKGESTRNAGDWKDQTDDITNQDGTKILHFGLAQSADKFQQELPAG
jgi:hypothetical protein